MEKNVQKVKNSLKFKAEEREGLLTIRFGVKKLVVPHKVRMLSDGKYMFLSFVASSELYKIEGKQMKAMAKTDDAGEAYAQLTPTRKGKRGRKARSSIAVSPELTAALSSIPAGFRLGYGPDGTIKLVKTRVRTKKGA